MPEGPTPAGLQNLGVESEDESDMRLHEASGKGDEKTVHQLLKDGADVNAKGWYDETPLFCAAGEGHEKVVELPLQNGARYQGRELLWNRVARAFTGGGRHQHRR
jgi:ankyrin repeat protein